MKKINWTEIALAAPTALAFANLGGMNAMLVVSALLGILMGAAKLSEKGFTPKREDAEDIATGLMTLSPVAVKK